MATVGKEGYDPESHTYAQACQEQDRRYRGFVPDYMLDGTPAHDKLVQDEALHGGQPCCDCSFRNPILDIKYRIVTGGLTTS